MGVYIKCQGTLWLCEGVLDHHRCRYGMLFNNKILKIFRSKNMKETTDITLDKGLEITEGVYKNFYTFTLKSEDFNKTFLVKNREIRNDWVKAIEEIIDELTVVHQGIIWSKDDNETAWKIYRWMLFSNLTIKQYADNMKEIDTIHLDKKTRCFLDAANTPPPKNMETCSPFYILRRGNPRRRYFAPNNRERTIWLNTIRREIGDELDYYEEIVADQEYFTNYVRYQKSHIENAEEPFNIFESDIFGTDESIIDEQSNQTAAESRIDEQSNQTAAESRIAEQSNQTTANYQTDSKAEPVVVAESGSPSSASHQRGSLAVENNPTAVAQAHSPPTEIGQSNKSSSNSQNNLAAAALRYSIEAMAEIYKLTALVSKTKQSTIAKPHRLAAITVRYCEAAIHQLRVLAHIAQTECAFSLIKPDVSVSQNPTEMILPHSSAVISHTHSCPPPAQQFCPKSFTQAVTQWQNISKFNSSSLDELVKIFNDYLADYPLPPTNELKNDSSNSSNQSTRSSSPRPNTNTSSNASDFTSDSFSDSNLPFPEMNTRIPSSLNLHISNNPAYLSDYTSQSSSPSPGSSQQIPLSQNISPRGMSPNYVKTSAVSPRSLSPLSTGGVGTHSSTTSSASNYKYTAPLKQKISPREIPIHHKSTTTKEIPSQEYPAQCYAPPKESNPVQHDESLPSTLIDTQPQPAPQIEKISKAVKLEHETKQDDPKATSSSIGITSVDHSVPIQRSVSQLRRSSTVIHKKQRTTIIAKTDKKIDDFTFLKFLRKNGTSKLRLCKENITKEYFLARSVLKSETVSMVDQVYWKTLHNPFIAPLIYQLQTVDQYYYFTSFLRGGYLMNNGRHRKHYTEDESKFYLAEITSALAYLHQKNIVYRNLTLESILLDNEGHIKITEFGCARSVIDCDERLFSWYGNISVMPPELLQNNGSYTASVDWWCLGVVAYQLLFGKNPFVGQAESSSLNLNNSNSGTTCASEESKEQFETITDISVDKIDCKVEASQCDTGDDKDDSPQCGTAESKVEASQCDTGDDNDDSLHCGTAEGKVEAPQCDIAKVKQSEEIIEQVLTDKIVSSQLIKTSEAANKITIEPIGNEKFEQMEPKSKDLGIDLPSIKHTDSGFDFSTTLTPDSDSKEDFKVDSDKISNDRPDKQVVKDSDSGFDFDATCTPDSDDCKLREFKNVPMEVTDKECIEGDKSTDVKQESDEASTITSSETKPDITVVKTESHDIRLIDVLEESEVDKAAKNERPATQHCDAHTNVSSGLNTNEDSSSKVNVQALGQAIDKTSDDKCSKILNRLDICKQILYEDVIFPADIPVTEQTEMFICQLLEKDAELRLGHDGDGKQVKGVQFFNGINWDDLECKRINPPFIPTVQSEDDTSYYDCDNDNQEEFVQLDSKAVQDFVKKL